MPLSCCWGKPTVKVVASPLDGLTGVTVITGVMFSDQLPSVPLAPVRVLTSWSFQTPSTDLSVQDRPSIAAGLERPGKRRGARGDRVTAASSKIVLTKFEPLHVPFEKSVTCRVPSGAIRVAAETRIVREGRIELDRDLGDLERAVVARDGQRRIRACWGRSTKWRRGSSGRAISDAKILRPGDRAGRAHDLEHLVGR